MPAPLPAIVKRHMRRMLMPSRITRTMAMAQSKRCTQWAGRKAFSPSYSLKLPPFRMPKVMKPIAVRTAAMKIAMISQAGER